MSEPLFHRLAVVGLGLVGGSVALASRERGLAAEVRGVDPGLRPAEARGFPLDSLERAGAWADAIVLAVPPAAFPTVIVGLAPHLAPSTVLTDTASVKGPVAVAVRRHLPAPERCVGAHPMAGGDRTGLEHARADLFDGAPCVITPEGREPAEVVDLIEKFWQGLGAFTVRRSPAEHDAITAALSHAPHVIAFAYARGLPREELALAGPGLRDFTRIARANPALWCEILLMNRGRIAEEMARFEKHLGEIRDALGRADRVALERALAESRDILEDLDR